ncbi:MAG: dihydrolipoyl dehydrogenase [Muribaculaceae bacterium]|nr:dihydrolipoyl dehydrogenase [Muribaculaceae bacterium]
MEAVKSDLIVIGAGPGGYEIAVEAARDGKSVTLIERDKPGGTCLNRGCIPTKALLRSAEVASMIGEASSFGVNVGSVMLDYAAAVARKDEVVAQLRAGVSQLLQGVNVVAGEAVFTGPDTVEVSGTVYQADNIVIATGSAPARLNVPGAEMTMTSDDILAMTELPGSLVIIGGGVIGVELACIMNAFGVKVTIVEYCKEILPAFDRDVAKRLRQSLTRRGIKIVTSAAVAEILPGYTVGYDSKGARQSIDADAVLMAVGRRPVYPDGLDKAGVETGPKGIVTDDRFRTTSAGIYAIGDVNGRCQLAHVAVAQGRVALADMCGRKSPVRLDVIPAAVFSSPEVAMVGCTEESLAGEKYAVAKSFFRSNGKAVAMGEADGIVKMIYEPESLRILGAHILGAHASDLIQEVAMAMTAGATLADLKNTVHGHPTLGEAVASVV